jgi:hypothetical protein
MVLHSCRIEKRHYTRGYHIEFFSRKSDLSFSEIQKSERSLQVNLESEPDSMPNIIPDISIETSTAAIGTLPLSDYAEARSPNKGVQLKEEIGAMEIASTSEFNNQPEQTTAQIHPSAAGSLLFGILSALCFVGLFISSFSPLALVIGLVAGLFLFAILAKWLSKRAFEDMYHARSRYSGRGLAAAGLALSVITIVAFLGLIAVLLFGIGFASLA